MKKLSPAVVDAQVLLKLHAKSPIKQRATWDYTKGYARQFKDAITAQLINTQSRRCAYCGIRLRGELQHRDHVAPKEAHPEYTFLTVNLVLACYHCNTECKGRTDTILTKHADYANCTFSIIHPYYDEPGDHIQFVGGQNKILVKVVTGSLKGRETVRLFRLADVEITKQRAKDAMFDSDLEYLPGPWRNGFQYVDQRKLKMKIRTSP